MSELNIYLLLVVDNNKCDYISIEKVVNYEGEAYINYQSVSDKKFRWLGTAQVSNKRRRFFYLRIKGLSGLLKRG